MSIVKIRSALEIALFTMSPALSTAYENFPYKPELGVDFQSAVLFPATPDNTTLGDGYYMERGIFSVTLHYAVENGSAAATTRAELIKALFKRGASFTSGGVTTVVEKTPQIGNGQVDDGRWVLPIRIRYYAQVFA